MKVLVTGGGGQLAQALVEAARRRPIEMIALGRSTLDITETEMIAERMHDVRPDLVINAAGYTAVDKAESEPDAAHLVNAVGAGNLNSHGLAILRLRS